MRTIRLPSTNAATVWSLFLRHKLRDLPRCREPPPQGHIAGLYVAIAVATDFFIKHYVFRWRTAMNDYYAASWHAVREIEGASQRVQEDTL